MEKKVQQFDHESYKKQQQCFPELLATSLGESLTHYLCL